MRNETTMTDDLTEFGDDEPEDAWHPDDPTDELISNLVRRARLLIRRRTRDPVEILDDLTDFVVWARRRRLSSRDQVRAYQLDEDIEFLRDRLRGGRS